MNGKLLIPIFLFIALQFFYDLFKVSNNTHWSIYYFSAQYLSWLVLVALIPKKRGFINRLPHIVLILGLLTYIVLELKYWNYSYKEYYAQVNDFKKYILPIIIIFIGLLGYLIPIKSTITKIFKNERIERLD